MLSEAVVYVFGIVAALAIIPVTLFVRHLQYKRKLKNQIKNPNSHFLEFLETIPDKVDRKRFQALWLPEVLLSTKGTRSELLGEGFYGRVSKVKVDGKFYCIKVCHVIAG